MPTSEKVSKAFTPSMSYKILKLEALNHPKLKGQIGKEITPANLINFLCYQNVAPRLTYEAVKFDYYSKTLLKHNEIVSKFQGWNERDILDVLISEFVI